MIGPFFYIDKDFLTHKIPIEKGEKRGDKIDNRYSHEKLYDDNYNTGDYIYVPRGRVVWDTQSNLAIIYIDACIEKIDGAVAKIAELFHLTDYIIDHDEHYVCPSCMKNIWEE